MSRIGLLHRLCEFNSPPPHLSKNSLNPIFIHLNFNWLTRKLYEIIQGKIKNKYTITLSFTEFQQNVA